MQKLVTLIFICIFSSFLSFTLRAQSIIEGKTKYDVKIYKILLRELKAAEKLEKAESSTINLFRVFTTRVEILKFLKTKNVEDSLKNPNDPQNNVEAKQIKNFYTRTKTMALKLDKDRNFNERPKFLLLYGLVLYEFEERNKSIPEILGAAFSTVKEVDLKHLAASKLGDYYFNLPDFKESSKYYREAIRIDPKSEWRTRHLYNLGWCYFKMENFDAAIKLMLTIFNSAKTAEEKKDYYYQQSIQKIPFFHLYNNNPDEGYIFVKNNSGVGSQDMTSFVKEVYNKGFFEKIDNLVIDVENNLEASKKYKELLDFQLEIYFHIASKNYKKNYAMLARLRKGILQGDTKNILEKEKKAQFIDDSKGLLNQHLAVINRKSFDGVRNLDDRLVLEDSVDILRLLLLMDKENSVSYRLKLAQLYNKTGQRDQAMKMLWDDYIKFGGVDNPEAGPYLSELLVVLDAMGEKASNENIEKIYQDYLKVGKDQNIRKIVYLKYFDFHYNKGDYKAAMNLVARHQKEFPNEKEDRKNMVVKLLNQSLKQKDKALFDSIREHAKSDIAVNTNPAIMRTVNTGHNTFLLEKVNKSLTEEGSDKSVAATKLAEIFRSNSIDRSNQLVSGFNAGLIFLNLGNTSSSSQIYSEFIDQLNPKEYKEYHDKLATIADNQLLQGNEDYSLAIYQNLIATSCKHNKTVNPSDVQKAFELLMLKNNETSVVKLLSSADSCQWSADLRKNIFTLIVEYMPWNDQVSGKRFLRYLTLQKVNKREDIEKIIEMVFVALVNKKTQISLPELLSIIDVIERNWLASLSYSSDFTKELRDLLARSSRQKTYAKERINIKNFAQFVTKAFDLFSTNIDHYTTYRPKYPSVFQIRSLLEISAIHDFVRSFDGFENLIDDEKNKLLYIEQIREALKPIEARIVSEESKLYSFMQTEGTLMRHKTIIANNVLYPSTMVPFIMDRL